MNHIPKRINIFEYLINIPTKQFTKLILRTDLTPNQITFVGGVFAFLGIIFYQGNRFISTILIVLYMIFDLVDGDIAREKKMFSKLGWWGDKMVDRVVESALLISFYISFDGDTKNQLLILFVFAYTFISQFSMEAINQIVRGNKKNNNSNNNQPRYQNKINLRIKKILLVFTNNFTLAHHSLLFLLTIGTLIISKESILFLLLLMSIFSFITLTICHFYTANKYDN